MFVIFFSFFLISQNPEQATPPSDFKDPFSNSPSTEPSLPEVAPPGETAPAPDLGTPSDFAPSPAAPALELAPPAELAPPPPDLVAPPPPVPPPAPSIAPAPLEAPRAKPFQFPQPTNEGPTTERVIENQRQEAATAPGDWAAGFGVGSAMNMNRHVTQMAFDLRGGYRLDANWEVGLLTYYRFVNVKYIGILAMGRYQFRLTDISKFRTELAFTAATGWAFRSKGSNGFNEGRWPFRAESEILLYAMPQWALTAMIGIETHILNYSNSTKYTNLMKGKGPPTQILLTAGTRYEF